jgi:hypothetical protein
VPRPTGRGCPTNSNAKVGRTTNSKSSSHALAVRHCMGLVAVRSPRRIRASPKSIWTGGYKASAPLQNDALRDWPAGLQRRPDALNWVTTTTGHAAPH